jgi:hypothetical protein
MRVISCSELSILATIVSCQSLKDVWECCPKTWTPHSHIIYQRILQLTLSVKTLLLFHAILGDREGKVSSMKPTPFKNVHFQISVYTGV